MREFKKHYKSNTNTTNYIYLMYIYKNEFAQNYI